ncbi:Thiol-disulfide oxidoreductase ResA [Symmachiella macrocystis]|uniref:Thiol-disulfide oxidoreductase ResA n=1 Tax=Symmachiella macrocystis TaxID=2527985 RepID=A0A5C6B1P4_9PLAN|nr:SUMF1/EgtB/PvdO family nonheme iron enzyme [Symmachiella macrocystis]TWU05156.1 Thiol-disulfide oxidoreductase ResA [Symmachiella macrocystis]
MAISFCCPHCENIHIFSDDLAGKRIRCQSCQQFATLTTDGSDVDSSPSTRRLSLLARMNRWHVLIVGSAIMACLLIALAVFRVGHEKDLTAADTNGSLPSPSGAPSLSPKVNNDAENDTPPRSGDVASNVEKPDVDLPLPSKVLVSPPTIPPSPPERITNSIGMQLTLVPAGDFQMGSPIMESGRDEDELLHKVALSEPYYMGVFEVTQEEYRTVMNRSPSYFSLQGKGREKIKTQDTAQFPVEWVSRAEAMEFCSKLSLRPDERAAERIYRLPTEAEWERACRSGQESQPFSSGDSLSSTEANINGKYPYGGGAVGPYLQRTVKVGSYAPNPFGLYDMDGNVSEWCHDQYDASYYRYATESDPQGPTHDIRVYACRGGAWCFGATTSRSAHRNYRPHLRADKNRAFHCNYIGFRVVCPVPIAFRKPIFGVGNKDAPSLEELLQKSNELEQSGDLQGAVQRVERYLKLFPHQREVVLRLAELEQRWAESLEDTGNAERAAEHTALAGQAIDKIVASFETLSESERMTLRPTLFWLARVSAINGDSKQMRTRLKLLFGAAYAAIEPIASETIRQALRSSPGFPAFDKQIYQEALTHQEQGAYEHIKKFEGFEFDFQLTDLDGNKVNLDDQHGKVVIVEFWGTWCPDCRDVVPHLIGLKQDYEQKDFEIIGISYERMPPDKSQSSVAEFLDKSQINYICLIGDGNDEVRSQIPGSSEYPTRLFVDRNGKVRMRVTGYQSRLELESFVKALLDGKQGKGLNIIEPIERNLQPQPNPAAQKKAAKKLQLAKKFESRQKSEVYKKWLLEIVEEFPNTSAAAEAAKLLENLGTASKP